MRLIERLADTVYATEDELPYLLPGAGALLAWVTITPAIREAWPGNREKAPRWVNASSAGVDFPAACGRAALVRTSLGTDSTGSSGKRRCSGRTNGCRRRNRAYLAMLCDCSTGLPRAILDDAGIHPSHDGLT
jgi:hypothetical protein